MNDYVWQWMTMYDKVWPWTQNSKLSLIIVNHINHSEISGSDIFTICFLRFGGWRNNFPVIANWRVSFCERVKQSLRSADCFGQSFPRNDANVFTVFAGQCIICLLYLPITVKTVARINNIFVIVLCIYFANIIINFKVQYLY